MASLVDKRRNKIETWREVDPNKHENPIPVGNDTYIGRVNKTADLLVGCQKRLSVDRGNRNDDYKHPPYEDFHHFTGNNKPWFKQNRPKRIPVNLMDVKSPEEFWFYYLNVVREKFDLTVDVMSLDIGSPLLGLWPSEKQVSTMRPSCTT